MTNLDPNLYGNQNSSMTKEDVEGSLDGLTVDEVIHMQYIVYSYKLRKAC